MNAIQIHNPDTEKARLTEWEASVARLNWSLWNRSNAVVAAFAKAIWLGVSATNAVATVEALYGKPDPMADADMFWTLWFHTLAQINGNGDDQSLEVA